MYAFQYDQYVLDSIMYAIKTSAVFNLQGLLCGDGRVVQHIYVGSIP